MSKGISLVGMEKVVVKLQKNMKKEAVKRTVKKNGSRLQQKAMENAPVGTPESTGIKGYKGGTLKRSIILDITDGGMTAESEATIHYAGYVEYGTRYMGAQPYMRPALQEVGKQFKRDMEKLVK